MLTIAVALVFVVSGLQASPAKPAPPQPETPKRVRSLEELDQLKSLAELSQFGLTAPDQRNHRSGTNLIMLALRATPFLKGDWFKAVALLGTEMIDVDLSTRLAYKTLFETGFGNTLDDIADVSVSHNAFMLLGTAHSSLVTGAKFELPAHQSVVARRETAVLALGESLRQRYTYRSEGGLGRNVGSDPSHSANRGVGGSLLYALSVFEELKAAGVSDQVLHAAIGTAAASLQRDRIRFDEYRVIKSIGQFVTYDDALRATFDQLAALTTQGTPADFLPELCGQLSKRSLLSDTDRLLFPQSEMAHEAMLKLVREDLARRFDLSKH